MATKPTLASNDVFTLGRIAVILLCVVVFVLAFAARRAQYDRAAEHGAYLEQCVKMESRTALDSQDAGRLRSLFLNAAIAKMPDRLRVAENQVVIITDLASFLDKHGVADEPSRRAFKRAFAFVLNQTFPIYVDAQNDGFVRAQLTFSQVGTLAPVVYAWAAILAHEGIHARGEQSELVALRCEIDLLRRYDSEDQITGLEAYTGELSKRYEEMRSGRLSSAPVQIPHLNQK